MNNLTRNNFDNNELEQRDAQSGNSYKYISNINFYENKNSCIPAKDLRNSVTQNSRPLKNNILNIEEKVDLESKLQNRHVELNDDIKRLNKDYSQIKLDNLNSCDKKENMTFDDTRFTNPISQYREINTVDYKFTPYLHVNPQNVVAENDRWMNLSRGGDSTRYLEKISTNKNYTPQLTFDDLLPKKFNKDNLKSVNDNNLD